MDASHPSVARRREERRAPGWGIRCVQFYEGWQPFSSTPLSFSEPVLKYLVDDYKADMSGYNVSKSVHVECGFAGNDPVKETKLAEKCMQLAS